MSVDNSDELPGEHQLGTWTRVYLHGLLALAIVGAIFYLLIQFFSLFEWVGDVRIASLLALLTLIFAPPLFGSFVLFVILPLLGKRQAWRGLDAWDDRLIDEVARAKQRAEVVLVAWPSADIRTLGVKTGTLQRDGKAYAIVYIPTAPQSKFGYIRVVEESAIERTDYTLREWQLYQFTFGALHPQTDAGDA